MDGFGAEVLGDTVVGLGEDCGVVATGAASGAGSGEGPVAARPAGARTSVAAIAATTRREVRDPQPENIHRIDTSLLPTEPDGSEALGLRHPPSGAFLPAAARPSWRDAWAKGLAAPVPPSFGSQVGNPRVVGRRDPPIHCRFSR